VSGARDYKKIETLDNVSKGRTKMSFLSNAGFSPMFTKCQNFFGFSASIFFVFYEYRTSQGSIIETS
jgi:hypothetical protein